MGEVNDEMLRAKQRWNKEAEENRKRYDEAQRYYKEQEEKKMSESNYDKEMPKYNRTIYVYSKDGNTLMHTYNRVKSIEHKDHRYVLELEHTSTELDITPYTVSFSDELSYIETENNYEWITNALSKDIASNLITRQFIKWLNRVGVIKGKAGWYSCELINMPKVFGLSGVMDWFYEQTRDSDDHRIEQIVEKLFKEIEEAYNGSGE